VARQVEASSAEERQERKRRWTLDGAGLLKKTFGVDVYRCPECGGRRRVLACLTSAAAVGAVLRHLKLPTVAPPLAPARGPPQLGLVG
jgi:hypothetical protein